MKKALSILFVLCLLLCLSACRKNGVDESSANHHHRYDIANCNEPKTCSCGATIGEPLGHQYGEASCTEPSICTRCGESSGEALGHDYAEATCDTPKTCARCGQTEGVALDHSYANGKCARCGIVDPASIPVNLSELYVMDEKYHKYQAAFTDSFGNTYNEAHVFNYSYRAYSGREPHVTVSLNGQYSTFSGTILATTAPDEDATYYINIYVDNTLKYSKKGYSKFTGAVDFSVNVKNGQTLKIAIGIEQSSKGKSSDEIAIANAQLKK